VSVISRSGPSWGSERHVRWQVLGNSHLEVWSKSMGKKSHHKMRGIGREDTWYCSQRLNYHPMWCCLGMDYGAWYPCHCPKSVRASITLVYIHRTILSWNIVRMNRKLQRNDRQTNEIWAVRKKFAFCNVVLTLTLCFRHSIQPGSLKILSFLLTKTSS